MRRVTLTVATANPGTLYPRWQRAMQLKKAGAVELDGVFAEERVDVVWVTGDTHPGGWVGSWAQLQHIHQRVQLDSMGLKSGLHKICMRR